MPIPINEKLFHVCRVRNYQDGTYFTYSRGKKDDWRLLYHTDNGQAYALLDKSYLQSIKNLGVKYGEKNVYVVFQKVYDLVTVNAHHHQNKPIPTKKDFICITQYIQTLKISSDEVIHCIKLFDCLYLTMIAEFYYVGTKLYHSVKHLGISQVLIKHYTAKQAAQYSRGKSYNYLLLEIKKYHIPVYQPLNEGN